MGRRKKISNKAFNEEGFSLIKKFERQALHASLLGFIHPLLKTNEIFSGNAIRSQKIGQGVENTNIINIYSLPKRV